MAIRPIFEFPYDSWAYPPEWFTDGEKILSVASPIDSAAGGGLAYYISRRMRFEGGTYQIKAYVDDAATWWIGTSLINTRMAWSSTIGQGLATGEFYIPPGIQRFDIILQNLPVAPTPCTVVFSIWKDGQPVYTSNGEHWLFDTVPIPDEDLVQIEDPRRSMPIWGVLPNWKDGLTERLEWRTDVMASETGAEQRRALRVHPRRTIEAGFLRQGAARSRMDLFFNGIGKQEILVPMWHEAVKMVEGIKIGASGVAFSEDSTWMREFKTGDLVWVNNGNPADYDILEVAEVEASRFGWRKRPTRNWPVGTRIFPLRKARIMDTPQLSNPSDRVGIAQVRFELSEPDIRAPSWGQFLQGTPLLTFKPNRRTDIRLDYSRDAFVLDNETSAINVVDWSGESKIGMKMSFTIFSRARVAAFRAMLAAARGRNASFYVPSHTHDIVLRKPIRAADGYIEAMPTGFYEAMARPHPTRLLIAVQRGDGAEPLYRAITNIVPIYDRFDRNWTVKVQSRVETLVTTNGIFPEGGGPRLYAPPSGGMSVAIFSGTTGEFIGHFDYPMGWEDAWPGPLPPEDEMPAARVRWAANVVALTNLLNSLQADSTIVLHTGPHFAALFTEWLTPELTAAIERCGGSQVALQAIKPCGNYFLLGTPDLGAGKGIERRTAETNHSHSASEDIEFVVRLQNGRPIAIEGAPISPMLAERFVLEAPLPSMGMNDVDRISFVSPARLDQDSVEIRHVTAGSRAIETSLVIRQLYNRRLQGIV